MSTVVAGQSPKQATWVIDDARLSKLTPEQMAKCLAAGAAVGPPGLIKSFKAVHETGVVVEVFPGADGQYDTNAPVFTVTQIAVAS